MRAELVPALGEQPHAPLGHRLAARARIRIRQRVHQERHVPVCDVALGEGRPRGKDQERRREKSGARHAAARVGENRDAPKIRGSSMMTAGTTNTSARNATAIVSASSPPNHAVGL